MCPFNRFNIIITVTLSLILKVMWPCIGLIGYGYSYGSYLYLWLNTIQYGSYKCDKCDFVATVNIIPIYLYNLMYVAN